MGISAIDAFREACGQAGYLIPEKIVADNSIQRFDIEKKGNKAGWCSVVLIGEVYLGLCRDWRGQLPPVDWSSRKRSDWTPEQKIEFVKRMQEIEAQAKAEKEQNQKAAAVKARKVWDQAKPAPDDHPYLKRKQIKPYGTRIDDKGNLLVPIYNEADDLISIQTIFPVKPATGSDSGSSQTPRPAEVI
ncbi:MAG: hypothetical protein HQK57_14695 [Deltaproteobacteria bacterium]|nr:hypothetical protein [Deltaproteobacteria bacterium]